MFIPFAKVKKKKKLPQLCTAAFLFSVIYAEMASTGQALTQTPQSMHASLISYWESPSEIASTGHSGRQAPQDTHSSLIL
jgi:hypothetical protein